jgi:serine protease Do
VTIQQVTAATADNFGLDRPRGAAVASVEPGGPADKAGIEPLDIILSVNGHGVEDQADLPSMIAEIKPGQTAQLEVWRDKAIKRISVTVEELKEKPARRTSAQGDEGGGSVGETATVNRIGLSVRVLTAGERTQLKTRASVVIVAASGPAVDAGLREGDIILSVNRTMIGSIAEFQAAIKNALKSATLLIQRDNQQSIVTVTLQ